MGRLALAAACSLAVPAAAQTAQQRNEARKLGGEALDLFKAGDYKAALAKFEQADKLVPAPTLKVHIARCLDKLDRLRDAAEKYREVIAIELKPNSPAPFTQARTDAVNELAKLLAQVPRLTVAVTGPGSEAAEVTLDAKPLPRTSLGEEQQMDPGFYQLEAKLGARTASKSVRLERGASEKVVLDFPEVTAGGDARPDYGPMRIAGYTLIGVGGAGLVVGIVGGALVLKDKSSVQSDFPDGTCNAAVADCSSADKFNRERTVASVGLAIGAGGLAVGLPLVIVAAVKDRARAEPDKAAVRPYFDGRTAGVFGSF